MSVEDIFLTLEQKYKVRTRAVGIDCSQVDDLQKSASFYICAIKSSADGKRLSQSADAEIPVTMTVAAMLDDPEIAPHAAQAMSAIQTVGHILCQRTKQALVDKMAPAKEPEDA